MKKSVKSTVFHWLFCFIVAFILIMSAASCSTQRNAHKAYKGHVEMKKEFIKRHDACVREQVRIQSKYR